MTNTTLLIAFLDVVKETENGHRIDPAAFPLVTAALELARYAVGGPIKYKGYPYNRLKALSDKIAALVGPEPAEECED